MSITNIEKRAEIDCFKNIIHEIDVQSLCNSLNLDTYSQSLVSEQSYCARGFDSGDPQCPYEAFYEFINGTTASPCFLIGCSGVGKSSFLQYFKREISSVVIYDFNKTDLSLFDSIKLHKFLTKNLIDIISNSERTIYIKLLYSSLKKISHNIIIKNAESDYDKLINGSLKDTSDILNNLQICLNSLLASDEEDDYAIFNNSLTEQLYTECQIIKHKIIIAIDNIDRRGDPGLESKAVKKLFLFAIII